MHLKMKFQWNLDFQSPINIYVSVQKSFLPFTFESFLYAGFGTGQFNPNAFFLLPLDVT